MTAVFDKLLSGIRLAIVLTGAVVLLGLLGLMPAYQRFFHVRDRTYADIRKTFLAAILLGLLLGWCFPAKIKNIARP